MKCHVQKLFMLFALSGLILSSCVSIPTLHTPETLDPGHISLHAGASTSVNDILNGSPVYIRFEGGWRVGVAEGFDMGFKYTHPYTFSWDSKFRLYNGSVKVAMDIGVTFVPISFIIVYPTLLIGQEHWYAGVKGAFGKYDILNLTDSENDLYYQGTTVIVGTAIGGEKVRFLLELNSEFFGDSDKPIFFPACGFCFRF